ncbi:DUF6507 family protein [Streptomyces sp. JNUCC 63]
MEALFSVVPAAPGVLRERVCRKRHGVGVTGWDIAPAGVQSVISKVRNAAEGMNAGITLYGKSVDGAMQSAGTWSFGTEGTGGGAGLVAAALAQFEQGTETNMAFLPLRASDSANGDPPQLRDQPAPCRRPHQHRRRAPGDVPPPLRAATGPPRPRLISTDPRSSDFAIALAQDPSTHSPDRDHDVSSGS